MRRRLDAALAYLYPVVVTFARLLHRQPPSDTDELDLIA